ncbi:MAG: hypothetical protein RR998_06360 [Oscillospiraceae bacterium]
MKTVSTSYRSLSPNRISVDEFRGIDLYNSPTNVSPQRSPQAPNMIRDVPGKVRKRMGYRKIAEYGARINGVYEFRSHGAISELVHSGTKLFLGTTPICDTLADTRSKAWQLGDKLFIADGKKLMCWNGTALKAASEDAYIPKINISRKPSGGGSVYEGLNLLGSCWTESFLSDAASSVYQMSYDGLHPGFIKVEQMKSADVWTELVSGTAYTFDATLGRITFASAPAASPTTGADNIRITVKKQRDDYEARINHCDMGVLYGVNGAADRLFLTGNSEYLNYDWYSGMNDASYFPVSSYCILGLNTRITGYSIIEDKLAAHKSGDEDGRNIVLRMGKLESDKAAFPIVNTLQGAGIVSGHTIAYLKTEPLFFSHDGVYAITPADINGERYSQNRSFYINNALEVEPGKADCCAVSYKDFYILSLGKKLYVLDSLLKSCEKGAPYSTHQYEAFLLTGIDARVLYRKGDKLRFGTSEGKLMEFYSDPTDTNSYNDEGRAITAYWDTPMFSTEMFEYKKSFRYLALKLLSASVTGVRVLAQTKGIWSTLFEECSGCRYFTFERLSFAKFTFSCDRTPKALGRRLRRAKSDKMCFRFINDSMNEPFGIYNYAVEYTIGGKI